MSLTRFDCHTYRGPKASLDLSSYVLFNPSMEPGCAVIGLSEAQRGGLGSQVACKLALEHFVEGVQEFFKTAAANSLESSQPPQLVLRLQDRDESNSNLLESAFRNANCAVYEFGHKLAAGGKLASSLTGVVIRNSSVAIARVGNGSVYLYRAGELFPFFLEKDNSASVPLLAEHSIGSNALVNVELASVEVAEGDSLIIISERLGKAEERALQSELSTKIFSFANPAQFVAKKLFPAVDNLPLVMFVRIGSEAIYLGEPV